MQDAGIAGPDLEIVTVTQQATLPELANSSFQFHFSSMCIYPAKMILKYKNLARAVQEKEHVLPTCKKNLLAGETCKNLVREFKCI